uniref:Integrase zinc-binding domain-containing protein n=1 Tax=Megaselia scalaris TaxID=36166 RepID=T1GNB0_MEGSC
MSEDQATLPELLSNFYKLLSVTRLIENIHSIAHPGRKATLKLIKDRCLKNLEKDVDLIAKHYIPCQKNKTRHKSGEMTEYSIYRPSFGYISALTILIYRILPIQAHSLF